MAAYEYRAVPFLAAVAGRDRKSADLAATQLTAALNAGATEGWEFYRLDNVSVDVRPGCLGFLTGTKSGTLLSDDLPTREVRRSHPAAGVDVPGAVTSRSARVRCRCCRPAVLAERAPTPARCPSR